MRAHDLRDLITEAMREKGYGGSKIIAQTPDGTEYDVLNVTTEYHIEPPGATYDAATFIIILGEQ